MISLPLRGRAPWRERQGEHCVPKCDVPTPPSLRSTRLADMTRATTRRRSITHGPAMEITATGETGMFS
jgi:hypothetical protein